MSTQSGQHKNSQSPTVNMSSGPTVGVTNAQEQRRIITDVPLFINSLFSMVSILLVFFTLQEMKQERNIAYQPDLVLGTSSVGMIWDETGELISEDDQTVFSLDYYEDENTYNNTTAYLKLYNIGSGNAKNLTVEWDFKEDIPLFVDILNSNPNIEASIDPPNEIKENYSLCFANKAGYGFPCKNIKIDYLLNNAQHYEMIELPLVYETIYRLLSVHYANGENFGLLADQWSIPPIHLLVSYSDVQGKFYSKRFEISMTYELFVPGGAQGICLFTLSPEGDIMGVPLTHAYYGAYEDVAIQHPSE